MYEGLINNLCKAADKWEKEHPIIGVGQLRVQDALRDAARALKEADSKLEQVTYERDAAVADIDEMVMQTGFIACDWCDHCDCESDCSWSSSNPGFKWRGAQTKEDTNDQ